MTARDLLYLTGTIGYFAFVALAIPLLAQWHREQGRSWLLGTAGLLALALMASIGGFLIIGTIRALTQNETLLAASDARLIAGAAPWLAFIFLAGRRVHREET